MSKNLERKKLVVAEIAEKFEKAQSAILVDYQGLNVEDTTELRKRFREAGVEYKVYKNNLVKRAIEGTDFADLAQDLTGPNAIAFGFEDPVTPAKVIKDFAKDHQALELKTGVVEGQYCDRDRVMKIANIPSRDELLGKFLGSIKAPVSNFAYLLSNIIKEKEGGEEVAEA